jgi:CubicO group peptidase (beta-lactamase class C family)
MTDAKYIGLDVHQATISVAVRDSDGKLAMEAILETKAETILQFVRGLRGSLHVVPMGDEESTITGNPTTLQVKNVRPAGELRYLVSVQVCIIAASGLTLRAVRLALHCAVLSFSALCLPQRLSGRKESPSMLLTKWTTGFACVAALGAWMAPAASAQSTPTSGNSAQPAGNAERIRRIEENAVVVPQGESKPLIRLSLQDLMEKFKVPGLSIAVIDNFQVIWAKGYGVTVADSKAPVTPKTLFQAGSISKPVAATAALYMVEQGKLALDENVNDKLKTWKMPENEFTQTEKVTLRRLMSHTGGLTVHGFPGYDVDAPLPTFVQILNGEKPANTAPVRVDFVPGTKFRYSGGGVTIEQLLMMDVSGKPFPALLRETVLDKIGMADSSYEQPLPPTRASVTAGGTYRDGKQVHGKWHIYPEMAAAGLWTTPTDLAHFAIEIALSKNGKSNRVLSQKMTNEMLTPVLEEAGLGFFLDKQNPGQFGHNGADEGFQALLTVNAETGKGFVIMANSDNGIAVGDLLLRSVAKEYAWSYKTGSDTMTALFLLAEVKGSPAALQRYEELKKTNSPAQKVDEGTLNGLGYMLLSVGKTSDAIVIFQRNVHEYPQSGNVYDSLGEAYMKAGQKELAIQNYDKSLQLDPKNQNAIEMLKKLKETK